MPRHRMSFQTRRDAWVEINLANLEHNIKELKTLINPKSKFLAVVKADAYGHGATMTAPTLLASGVDILGVASIDEGIQLRESGISAPVLVLGTAPAWAFQAAIENDIQLSVFDEDHIYYCQQIYEKLKVKPKVHIKVDTGMHRIGIAHNAAADFIKEVFNTGIIQIEGVFTHLACAEDRKITEMQKKNWENVVKMLSGFNIPLHALNTAGLIGYDDMQYDMVRAGIGIYGLSPDIPELVPAIPDFKQVMSLKGRIVYVKNLEKGCGVSYGYSFITDNPITKIATIPIGYADGVPRALSNKIYGILNGKIVKQVGNITMDQMMFDISNVNHADIGDVITILGKDGDEFISIDSWAKELNTINYEITCKLRVRLPRVYTRNY